MADAGVGLAAPVARYVGQLVAALLADQRLYVVRKCCHQCFTQCTKSASPHQ